MFKDVHNKFLIYFVVAKHWAIKEPLAFLNLLEDKQPHYKWSVLITTVTVYLKGIRIFQHP